MRSGIKSFDVLDRNLDINQNYFLEASAGTGKTFSIENIVVRLLLSDNPLQLDEILVVTFTRAATRDLKVRIRSSIKGVLKDLKVKKSSLDYVKAIIDSGEVQVHKAERILKHSLLSYDQAHIYTIHQFCFRMLSDHIFEGNYALDGSAEDSPLSNAYMITIIRDYFRTEIRPDNFSPQQLNILLKEYVNSMESLEKAILDTITKGIEIASSLSYQEQLEAFQNTMKVLCDVKGITGEKILQDFRALAPFFKDIRDIKKQIKPDVYERVEKFASLFDKKIWSEVDFERLIEDQLYIVDLLDPKNLNKKVPPAESEMQITDLRNVLKDSFQSLVAPQITFSRMASGCRKLLKRHLEEEELLGFDELLETTRLAVQNPKFVDAVRSKFRSAIIDEFQDTDNQQWEIFQKLFLKAAESWGNLYLVGDPKQSIYAFRQADIYTYITAGKALGLEHQATLDTNFRSQPSLIHALNSLFKESSCPGFIGLPKINECLDFKEVKAPLGSKERSFSDRLKSLNFCIAEDLSTKSYSLDILEEKYFFPYFVQEIQRLNKCDGIGFSHFAILVSDRFQAQRIGDFLKEWNIPSMTQRSSSLADSDAFAAIRDLLKGVLSPNNESTLKTALGSRLIGWTHDKVRKLDELDLLQEILTRFYSMRRKLFEEGFSSFFEDFISSCWSQNSLSIREELLQQEGGDEFYQDLQSILELLLDEQCRYSLTPIGLLKCLDDFKILSVNEDDRLKRALDPTQDAVNILTIHSSKGLEFEVVFALGLVKISRPPGDFIPITINDQKILSPILDKSNPEYVQYRKEIDAEKMRQLYVAMTRAKYRLYCPVAIIPNGKKLEMGEASPMQLFLARLNRVLATEEILYERIQGEDGSELRKFIDSNAQYITASLLNKLSFDLCKLSSDATPELFLPAKFILPGSPIYIHSFTSLSKHEQGGSSFYGAPRDFKNVERSPHTLPSGSETGNLLHLILENFQHRGEIVDFVRPYVEYSDYGEWCPTICEIISNVLQTKFNDGFKLSDVNPEKCFRETEFMYPYQSHFLKGIIDLIFEHQGKFYIVDWKSNWLGPDTSYYTQDKLELAMRENNYFFQAQLYKEALQKFLNILDDRKFDELFGGSYYLFVRGLDPESSMNYGVYKCPQ
jgi:exodeoxyribonuclease V beta subunit